MCTQCYRTAHLHYRNYHIPESLFILFHRFFFLKKKRAEKGRKRQGQVRYHGVPFCPYGQERTQVF